MGEIELDSKAIQEIVSRNSIENIALWHVSCFCVFSESRLILGNKLKNHIQGEIILCQNGHTELCAGLVTPVVPVRM